MSDSVFPACPLAGEELCGGYRWCGLPAVYESVMDVDCQRCPVPELVRIASILDGISKRNVGIPWADAMEAATRLSRAALAKVKALGDDDAKS